MGDFTTAQEWLDWAQDESAALLEDVEVVA